jgi:hypothetical protein
MSRRKFAALLAAAALGTSLAAVPAASAAVSHGSYSLTCGYAQAEYRSWMAVINELDPLGNDPNMDYAYDQMLYWQGQVLDRC